MPVHCTELGCGETIDTQRCIREQRPPETKQLENLGTWCWETSQATIKRSGKELAPSLRGRGVLSLHAPGRLQGAARVSGGGGWGGGGQLGASRATTSRAEAAGTRLLFPMQAWNSMWLDLQEGTHC